MRNTFVARSSTCIRREDETDAGSPIPGAAQAGTSPAKDQPDFENSPLPAAMLAVAHHDSPENRRVLYESMFKTWFLVPIREAEHAEAPGLHDIRPDTASSFSLEHDSAGQLVAVAFTDEEALRNWNKEILWIALQGAGFFKAVLSTGAEEIVINPFEPEDPGSKMIRPGGRVTRWELEALAQGIIPESEADEGRKGIDPAAGPGVLIATPKEMPSPETLRALAAPAASFTAVRGMYFGQVNYPDGVPHRAVAVDFAADTSERQMQSVFKALAREARRCFHNSDTDFFAASSPVGQAIVRGGKKFYG